MIIVVVNLLPRQMYYFMLGVCHCVAFSSCVSNPVLYGWLNTNLRKEFLKVIIIMMVKDGDGSEGDDVSNPVLWLIKTLT